MAERREWAKNELYFPAEGWKRRISVQYESVKLNRSKALKLPCFLFWVKATGIAIKMLLNDIKSKVSKIYKLYLLSQS